MSRPTMITLLEEGLANGRVSPQLAAYIAAEVLGVEARLTGYDDTVRLNESPLIQPGSGRGANSAA